MRHRCLRFASVSAVVVDAGLVAEHFGIGAFPAGCSPAPRLAARPDLGPHYISTIIATALGAMLRLSPVPVKPRHAHGVMGHKAQFACSCSQVGSLIETIS